MTVFSEFRFNMKTLAHWLFEMEQGNSPYWLYDIGALLIVAMVSWSIWQLLYHRWLTFTQKTSMVWDSSLVEALHRPINYLIIFWPLLLSLGILVEKTTHYSTDFFLDSRQLLVIWVFVWVLIRLVTNVEDALSATAKDITSIGAISKVLRLTIVVVGGLAMMQNLGISLSGMLTFGGVGGLIAGMAAKEMLANFFGGMMIYMDKPFKVGDWIRSPDRDIEGTVERIGFRMTVVRTFDKRPLYVPNAVFSSVVVENASRMFNRRIKQTIGLRYQDADKVATITQEIRTMLQHHMDIDKRQTIIVNFFNYGGSSLEILVYCFTRTVDWVTYQNVQQDVMLKVMSIVHEHGADFAFPTTTLEPSETFAAVMKGEKVEL